MFHIKSSSVIMDENSLKIYCALEHMKQVRKIFVNTIAVGIDRMHLSCND
jgi:hypothetical protein